MNFVTADQVLANNEFLFDNREEALKGSSAVATSHIPRAIAQAGDGMLV
mgnify:CR=1 FL=1